MLDGGAKTTELASFTGYKAPSVPILICTSGIVNLTAKIHNLLFFSAECLLCQHNSTKISAKNHITGMQSCKKNLRLPSLLYSFLCQQSRNYKTIEQRVKSQPLLLSCFLQERLTKVALAFEQLKLSWACSLIEEVSCVSRAAHREGSTFGTLNPSQIC